MPNLLTRLQEIEARLQAASTFHQMPKWYLLNGEQELLAGDGKTNWALSTDDTTCLEAAPIDLRFLLDTLRAALQAIDVLQRIANDPRGDDEPGFENKRYPAWEFSQWAQQALATFHRVTEGG